MSISNRTDFLFTFDVIGGNPNGDPDNENRPRVDDDTTSTGHVTNLCLKRKIRNVIGQQARPGFGVWIYGDQATNIALDEVVKKHANVADGVREMCQRYYDVRAFGGVLGTGKAGGLRSITGPVVLNAQARSLDQITILSDAITRSVAIADKKRKNTAKQDGEGEIESESGGEGRMGMRHYTPYGLYCAYGSVNPFLADESRQNGTGFNDHDLNVLFESIERMFSSNGAAGRGEMSLRNLIAFEHKSTLGVCQPINVFNKIKVRRRDLKEDFVPILARNPNIAATKFDDYEFEFPEVGSEPVPGVKVVRSWSADDLFTNQSGFFS